MTQAQTADANQNSLLTDAEQAKRNDLMRRKPHVAKKLARISEMEARGEVSPIIRLEKSYLCNFKCTHCSAEYYMDRHLDKVLNVTDERQKMDLEDVRRLSREADELGLARFVITGGEPLVMKDFDDVVAALDPEKHYIVTDTNGWFLDRKSAQHLNEIGVEKVQLSLDSMIESDHDHFRNKPGSYKRVMRAVDACMEVGLNLILSTVLVKGRAQTEEFREMCRFVTERGIGLYVSYAKPTGSCTEHPEFVIDKHDADAMRELERDYNVFTHMTPSYGSLKGCITVKGIVTVTSTMEVTPCPYIDFSLGNLRESSLKEVLQRGLDNPWIGPYRPDCLIGEDPQFIKIHTEKTRDQSFLPLPWGQGFSDHDSLLDSYDGDPRSPDEGQCDAQGRLLPNGVKAPANAVSRHYFRIAPPKIDYAAIHARVAGALGDGGLPDVQEFQARAEVATEKLRADPEYRGLLNGPVVPFLLPQGRHGDIGAALEQHYLPAVAQTFTGVYPKQEFKSPYAVGLAGKFGVVDAGRHQRLIDAMEKEAVIGLYLPCLQEYSVPAAIERMERLPEQFLLSGGYDTCAALVGTPGMLVDHEHYSPLLWLAGLSGESAGVGYHFEAYGQDLIFNRRAHRDQLSEFWNAGLTVLA